MKKFNELPNHLQEIAIQEFENQGLTPNLDLYVNALPQDGNFDWTKSLQGFEFWNLISRGEIANPKLIKPKKASPTPEKTVKKSVKKSVKKTAK